MRYTLIILFILLNLVACEEKRPSASLSHGHTPAGQGTGEDELYLSDQQIQLGNITVGSIRERQLGEEFSFSGVVSFDQDKIVSIASRVMGRIEKLYFKNSGETVSKGALLYEIFSEDLNMAVRELLLASEKFKQLKNEQASLQNILQAARTKLRLYGLTEEQIAGLERENVLPGTIKIYSKEEGILTSVDVKEGDYVMEGATVLHLADLSAVWVEAQVYSDYLYLIKNGMQARVTFPGFPSLEFTEKIAFINPELNTSSKIDLIRIEVSNKKQLLKPGLQAYVNILSNKITALAVPTDAIIRDGSGAVVWVESGEKRFKSKMVSLGLEAEGYTEIKSGLEKGDRVVVTGAYLLNSEYIFKKGANPMEGHDMSKM
jgi:membrane fusion protein, copper/silver efflux system